jgi:uncharacterized protein involved in exopolysaccharide biosynthesis
MDDSTTLADYWMALYSRKWVILATAVLAMVAAIAISYLLPPSYDSRSEFYFPTNFQTPSYITRTGESIAQAPLKPTPDEKETGIHIGILKSKDMAAKLHAKFPEKDLQFFRRNVDFVSSKEFFIDIYVRDTDPKLAAAVANAYVDAYRDFHKEALRELARDNQAVLQKQVKMLEQRLVDKTSDMKKFQQKSELLSKSAAEQFYSNRITELENKRSGYEADLRAKRESLAASGKSEVSAGQSDWNPRLDEIRKLQAKIDIVDDQIHQQQQANRATLGKAVEYEIMDDERQQIKGQLANARRNLDEARMQIDDPKVEIIQVQTAMPAEKPSFPIISLNAIVAMILGIAAGCYNALLLEYLNRLKIARLRRTLDLSVLGEVAT